ncbi:MAG: DUF4233 domain-containing protein [Actinobacteria bacterium]|nr:DUF4233 domain-containing protein [Actinomycetota bacterium]
MGHRVTQDPTQHDDGTEEEFVLSPSETLAHNSAMRVAGAGRRGGNQATKTQHALASIVLGFELIVVFLIGMTVFGLRYLDPPELGIWGGLALCAVIIVALATMRFGRTGIVTGWVVHGLMLLTGFVLPMALIVGVIFTALWVYCMVKGAQIDRDRMVYLKSLSNV